MNPLTSGSDSETSCYKYILYAYPIEGAAIGKERAKASIFGCSMPK
jgi:hypothetical protein